VLLQGLDAVDGLCHAVRAERGVGQCLTREVTVRHVDGRRYGGFVDACHAAFFIEQMGWQDVASMSLEPKLD